MIFYLFDNAQTPTQSNESDDWIYVKAKLGKRAASSSKDGNQPINPSDLVQELVWRVRNQLKLEGGVVYIQQKEEPPLRLSLGQGGLGKRKEATGAIQGGA